ncbi:Alpha/Beta hydrolase protein [Biscogniauxia marginata]|nr:Alpha/Beta hydrolase protein [Biscogniauxia marginata]
MLSANAALPLLLLSRLVAVDALSFPPERQRPLQQYDDGLAPGGISNRLFASLERLSRLVDITYCVGTSGITQPFTCVSRCKDFPTLNLVTTWNTGALMSDSCGYIAVDHGTRQPSPTSSAEHASAGQPVKDEGKGAVIVAFRGTYSITNTIVDLSTVPQEYMPYPAPDNGGQPPEKPEHTCHNCTVHMGFLTSWQSAREYVLPALKPLHAQYPDYPIHLVGHSLGGAVAALAALELKVSLEWDKVVVTTFGEPRVGNQEFTEYLDSVFELVDNEGTQAKEQTFRRVTHMGDPVPLLPLLEWGYRSHAGEIFISKSELPPEPSDIHRCDGDSDPECSSGLDGESVEAASRVIAEERAKEGAAIMDSRGLWDIPTRYKLWELLFAHRDYFWRLGLCIPGGDPIDWGRDGYPNDEL